MASANFLIKDVELLKSSLLNFIYYSDNSLTDFNVGAVMRTMLEAVAQEEEEIYFRLWQGIQVAIQQSILYSFNFVPGQGTKATGLVIFGRDSVAPRNIVVAAGTTILSPSGYSYKTSADVVIQQNTLSVFTPVTAVIPGSTSNLLTTGTLLQMSNPIYGVSWVQNATPISGGTDTESNASVFQRFTRFIASLSRGTLTAIQYGASTAQIVDISGNITEQVIKVRAYDYPTNLGFVDCFIDNGLGTASTDLITLAQRTVDGYTNNVGTVIEGWKSAGVIVLVSAVTPVQVSVDYILAATDYFGAKPYVDAAITQYFNDLDIGQPLNYEKLVSVTMNSNSSIIDIQFNSPGGDIDIQTNERIILSTVSGVAGTATYGNL